MSTTFDVIWIDKINFEKKNSLFLYNFTPICWFSAIQQNQPIKKHLEFVNVGQSDACCILVQSTNQNALTHETKGRVWTEFIIRCPTMEQALEASGTRMLWCTREPSSWRRRLTSYVNSFTSRGGNGCGWSCSGVGRLCGSSCWTSCEEDKSRRKGSHSLISRGHPVHLPHQRSSSS